MEYLVQERNFRGVSYKIACVNRPQFGGQDPSFFSHDDESVVRDRDWNIQPGDVVVDIGSAFGSYALTALAVGASHAVCFNYNQEENGFVTESLKLNGWENKLTIISEGIYSKTGYLNDSTQHFSEFPVDGYFKVSKLDDIELNVNRVDWMKLDVEGAEVDVLQGAEKLISRFRPKVLVENHQFKDNTIEQRVRDTMNGHGYKFVSCFPYHGVSHSLFTP